MSSIFPQVEHHHFSTDTFSPISFLFSYSAKMATLLKRLQAALDSKSPRNADELSFHRPESRLDEKRDTVGINVDGNPLQDGDLTFDEATRGGLGRHLGFWSTYFLMYAPSIVVNREDVVAF